MVHDAIRIIASSTLRAFSARHPETAVPLDRWLSAVRGGAWSSMSEIKGAFGNVVTILNADRARFKVAGGDYRMVVAFNFRRQIAFIKFVGTHAEYDRIDALAVSQF
jgi:mRNA interferase HigB